MSSHSTRPENDEDEELSQGGRYGLFLYYKEENGESVITNQCVSHRGERCTDFDLYVNLRSIEMQTLLSTTATLVALLQALGIAATHTNTIGMVLNDISSKVPCGHSKNMPDKTILN